MRVSFRGLVNHTSGRRPKQKREVDLGCRYPDTQLTLTCSWHSHAPSSVMRKNGSNVFMHLLIWHAYSCLHVRHVDKFFLPVSLWDTTKVHVFTHPPCRNSIGWGQKADWMRSRRVLLVFWRAKQTGIQGCKKVSSVNGHSSNLFTPLPGQRFHSGGPCMFILKRSDDIPIPLNPISLLSSAESVKLPFPPALPPQVRRCTWWTLPNYPWTPPFEVVLREWCKSVTFAKMSVSFQRKQ